MEKRATISNLLPKHFYGEGSYTNGSGGSEGTQSYSRTGLNIADWTYAGGTVLTVEMRAYRSWGGSGCNESYNYIDNNSWTITVHYSSNSCPTPSSLSASNISSFSYIHLQ